MAIGPEFIALTAELRLLIDDTLDTVTRQTVQAWARAWDTLVATWDAAAQQVAAAGPDATAAQLARLDRATAALDATRIELARLITAHEVLATNAVDTLTAAAGQYTPLLIASQYPAAAGPTSQVAALFNGVDPAAIRAIVDRTTQQITSLSLPLTDSAVETMKRELINGIAQGLSPRDTANRIVSRAESGFNGGLARALTITRTETLDAYRTAAKAHQDANADVLAGWMWAAELDDATCEACWALDGTVHDLEESGPDGHQQCRCSRVPLTKTWAELGFALEEPASTRTAAEEVFRSLTLEQQLKIMGPARLAALDSGRIAWTDLATERQNVGWRRSFVPTPVAQLTAAA